MQVRTRTRNARRTERSRFEKFHGPGDTLPLVQADVVSSVGANQCVSSSTRDRNYRPFVYSFTPKKNTVPVPATVPVAPSLYRRTHRGG
jgi:hypothetical protein